MVLTVDFHTPAPLRAAAVADRLDPVADRVDAVFATDDLSAAEVLEWARGRGLRVPEDFKVVGFDGTLAVRRALPGLTTVRQPIAAIAREAVASLVAQIEAAAAGEDPRAALERLVELLIHVGMDTVNLQGEHFTPRVKQHDKVRRGQTLVDVDWKAVADAGYKTVTPVVVSNATAFGPVTDEHTGPVERGDALYAVEPAPAEEEAATS